MIRRAGLRGRSLTFLLAFVAAGCALPATAGAQAQGSPADTVRAKDVPTRVEYYYRIRWGQLKQFIALYERNHKPLLEEMRKDGFVLDMQTEYPFTHLAGGPRWDMRVTITYRDAAAAINDPAWVASWSNARKRLFRDIEKLDAEEATRFSLLEDHWDVIVSDFPE